MGDNRYWGTLSVIIITWWILDLDTILNLDGVHWSLLNTYSMRCQQCLTSYPFTKAIAWWSIHDNTKWGTFMVIISTWWILEMQKNTFLMCSKAYNDRPDGKISWFPLIKAIEYCAQQITSKTTSSAVFTMKYKYCSQTWWHQRNSCITLYYSDIGASIPGLRFLFTCIPIALPWSQLLIPHCYRDRIATSKTKTVSSHLEMKKIVVSCFQTIIKAG